MESAILERYPNPQERKVVLGSYLRMQGAHQKIQLCSSKGDLVFDGTVQEFVDCSKGGSKDQFLFNDLINRFISDVTRLGSGEVIGIELGEMSDDDEYPRNVMERCHQSFALTSSDLKDEVKLHSLLMMIGKNANVKIVCVDINERQRSLAEGSPNSVLNDMRIHEEYLKDPVLNISIESGSIVIRVRYRSW